MYQICKLLGFEIYLLDRCFLVSFSGFSSWKTVKEDSRPFFLLPYVAIAPFHSFSKWDLSSDGQSVEDDCDASWSKWILANEVM